MAKNINCLVAMVEQHFELGFKMVSKFFLLYGPFAATLVQYLHLYKFIFTALVLYHSTKRELTSLVDV